MKENNSMEARSASKGPPLNPCLRRGLPCLRCGLPVFVFLLMGAEPPHVATTPHLSPEQERATFKVPDGFEVQLVAAEPDINKPINMAFDAKGRLWVTSTTEYPYPAKDRPGKDCVKVLSDFGPDGRARKVETFAADLNIPIGILPYKDGAIVYSIPNIWFLRDTDGDGKCDKREVLYSGFGHKDTHGMVNGFFMGFDGWVYACHGYANDSTVKGTDGHEIKMNSGNVFRFKPDGSRVELFAQGQVNPFGSCMDKWGNLFTACCHSKPITLVMRGAVYESFSKPHDGLGFAPAMVHNYRGSTALCGLSWYEADYFPKEYQESFYLGDVVNNCVNRFTVTWKGATPTAHQQADFLTSTDPWFRPCDIKLGPDGALYIADFYNRIIGHYEVPLNHPGRDRTSGRIWRVVRKDKPVDKVPDRTKASAEELVEDLDAKNILVRFAAMNELVQRGGDAIIPLRISIIKEYSPLKRSQVLWALHRVGGMTDTLLEYFWKEGEQLHRVHFIRSAQEFRNTKSTQWIAHGYEVWFLQSQAHQLAAAVYAEHPVVRHSYEILCRHWAECKDDPFLLHSIRMALRDAVGNGGPPIGSMPKDTWEKMTDVALGSPTPMACEVLFVATQDMGAKMDNRHLRHCIRYCNAESKRLAVLLESLDKNKRDDLTQQKNTIVAALEGFELRGDEPPENIRSWAILVGRATLDSPDPTGFQRGIEIAKAMRSPVLDKTVADIAANPKRNDAVRTMALATTVASHSEVVSRVLSDATESLALREAAAKALADVNKPEARDALVVALATAPGKLAATIAGGLAGNKQSAEQLCLAVEKGQASPRLLADRTIRQKLEAHGLKDRVDKLTQGLPPVDKQVEVLIAKKRDQFQKAKSDVTAGKELFTKHCAICHQVGGQGAKIGPQLDGIGIRGLDRLLEDTLDPSRNVDPTFRTTNLQLADGRALSGLFLREDGTTLIFADSQGKEFTVKKDQIEQRTVSPLSAMPTNVLESLKDDELINVLAYLLTLKK